MKIIQYTILFFITLISYLDGFSQDYERYKHLLDTTIQSSHLGFDKRITITVPFEWQKNINKDFPLIIIFDRQNQRSHQFILNTIDYLTSNEQMPSAVIVGIESIQHRHQETTYKSSLPNGKAEENEKFIFEELIPMIKSDYNANSFTMLIGHSRYGYFTTSLMANRMNELNAVISLSPFFTQSNIDLVEALSNKVNNTEFISHKYYRYGIGNDYPDDFEAMAKSLDSISTDNGFFNQKGWLFPEADHNVTPGLTISIALYEIFEYWSNQQRFFIDSENKDLSIEAGLSEKIKNHYGQELSFSIGILNGKGWHFFNDGDYEKAIESWELLIKYYPNFAQAYLYVLEAQKELKLSTQETATRFKKSLENTEIYTDKEKEEFLKKLE